MTARSTAIKLNDTADDIQHYCTPPWAARSLVRGLHALGIETYDQIVYDPCAGQGHILHALQPHYAQVQGDDMVNYSPRHYTPTCRDYLVEETPFTGHVVTNPPFCHFDAFVRRARWNGASLVAMLVRITALAGADRLYELYRPHRPSHVLIHTSRVHMEPGAPPAENGKSAMDNIWLIWHGKSTQTTLHWLTENQSDLELPGDYFDTCAGKSS